MNETRVVSAEWVNERRGEVKIVDVREPWEFEGIGHIPGAVSLPFDSFRSEEGDEGMLPGEDVFSRLLGERGISREADVVAYDDTHGVFAARFLVTCELYGHSTEKLHLLDGDFSSWNREFQTDQDSTEPEATTYEIERSDETPLITRAEVAAAIDEVTDESGSDDGHAADTVIVDTREAWEFEEGHLPGAVRLDWRELVDDDSRGLKPDAEMEEILADRGISPDRRVILYCNTARRISHTYLALRHLGYEDLAFYEGSLTEWEREGGPIETSEAA